MAKTYKNSARLGTARVKMGDKQGKGNKGNVTKSAITELMEDEEELPSFWEQKEEEQDEDNP